MFEEINIVKEAISETNKRSAFYDFLFKSGWLIFEADDEFSTKSKKVIAHLK